MMLVEALNSNNNTKWADSSGFIQYVLQESTVNLVFFCSTLFLSLDEMARFLLYVKTLDYQDKPDYQHLKGLLATVVGGRLDFSRPQGPAGKSSTKVVDPHTREKVRRTEALCLNSF